MGLIRREEWLLARAKVIVLREQDVAAREHELVRRRQELAEKEHELESKKSELQQLRFEFTEIASGRKELVSERESPTLPLQASHPALARTMATIATRVLTVLEMEPRAFSPSELFNVLELPPPIETLRTTLWKMAQRGLIARPFSGVYCALQYEAVVRTRSEQAG